MNGKSKDRIEEQFDASRRLLHVRFIGRIGVAEMEDHLAAVERLDAALESGFHLATDLSRVECIDVRCRATLVRVMEALRASGLRSVVRWIPRPERDIGFAILSQFHYPADVHCVTCETRAEWEEWLADVSVVG